MSLPTNLPGCGAPATTSLDIFTRSPDILSVRYSLDGRLDVCGRHLDGAYAILRDAGFRPYQTDQSATRCGDGYDYVAKARLTTPVDPLAQARADALRWAADQIESKLVTTSIDSAAWLIADQGTRREIVAKLRAWADETTTTPTTPEGNTP